MVSAPAPGEAQRSSLALVNTRRARAGESIDELATPVALRRWLRDRGLGEDPSRAPGRRIDDVAVATVRDLRAAVRELLLARIEDRRAAAGAVDLVNAASAAVPNAPRRTQAAAGAGLIELACAALAADAIDLVTGPDHAVLRACGAPGCVRLLLADHPRRQWCSKRCGDRVRAGRYYRRHQHT
jgi:predicted RNA-binding Zn ribbon-like protein